MKKYLQAFILFSLIFTMLVACTPKEKNVNITKDFLDKHAKIGMTEKEVHNILGSPTESFFEDTVDIDIYAKTKKVSHMNPYIGPEKVVVYPKKISKMGILNIFYLFFIKMKK